MPNIPTAREEKQKIITTRNTHDWSDDVRDELCDTIKDDVKDWTASNVYEPFEEFVKQVGNRSQSETINELRLTLIWFSLWKSQYAGQTQAAMNWCKSFWDRKSGQPLNSILKAFSLQLNNMWLKCCAISIMLRNFLFPSCLNFNSVREGGR